MKLKNIRIFVLLLAIFYILNILVYPAGCVYAINKAVDIYEENEKERKVSEDEYILIQKLLEEINIKIKNIDEKFEETRKLAEFESYPAVRLSIDTPYFGLAYLIESKLIIKDNVSPKDIFGKYNIREIVETNSIRLADISVAGIVVSTKDVKISKNLTISEAEEVKSDLVSYMVVLDKTSEYLDKKLYETLKEYYSEEKKIAISTTSTLLKEVQNKYNRVLEKCSYISTFSDLNTEKSKSYKEIIKKIEEYKKVARNIYNSSEEITIIENEITKLSLELDNEIKYLDEVIEKINSKLTIQNATDKVITKMEKEIEYIEKYADEAVKKDASNIDEDKIYSVVSHSNLENMKKILQRVKELRHSVEIYDQPKETAVEKEELSNDLYVNIYDTYEYNKDKLEEIQNIYVNFLSREVAYMLSNIQTNVKNVKKDGGKNFKNIDEIKYYYLSMQDYLEYLSDIYVSTSVQSNIYMVGDLKKILERTITILKND